MSSSAPSPWERGRQWYTGFPRIVDRPVCRSTAGWHGPQHRDPGPLRGVRTSLWRVRSLPLPRSFFYRASCRLGFGTPLVPVVLAFSARSLRRDCASGRRVRFVVLDVPEVGSHTGSTKDSVNRPASSRAALVVLESHRRSQRESGDFGVLRRISGIGISVLTVVEPGVCVHPLFT